MKYKRSDRSAFTLVELIVAISILAILVGTAVPMVTRHIQSSKNDMCKAGRDQLITELKEWYSNDQKNAVSKWITKYNGTSCGHGGTFAVSCDNGKILVKCTVHGETDSKLPTYGEAAVELNSIMPTTKEKPAETTPAPSVKETTTVPSGESQTQTSQTSEEESSNTPSNDDNITTFDPSPFTGNWNSLMNFLNTSSDWYIQLGIDNGYKSELQQRGILFYDSTGLYTCIFASGTSVDKNKGQINYMTDTPGEFYNNNFQANQNNFQVNFRKIDYTKVYEYTSTDSFVEFSNKHHLRELYNNHDFASAAVPIIHYKSGNANTKDDGYYLITANPYPLNEDMKNPTDNPSKWVKLQIDIHY